MTIEKDKMVVEEFNDDGKLIHYKTVSGYEVWFTYDENGNLKERRDNEGNVDTYLYDENGELIPFEKYMM